MEIDEMEETLRACQPMKNRQMKSSIGSNKFHQRAIAPANPMASKTTRAVRAIREKVESSGSESESIGSEEEVDRRRVCIITTSDQEKSNKDHRTWQKNTVEGERRDSSDDRRRAPIVDLPDTMIEGAGRD